VHVKKLEVNRKTPLIADSNYTQPLSITNSFGVPSANPKIWQKDMARAVKAAKKGQVLIGSFQGTSGGSVTDYIDDFVNAALLVKETGAPILEANLSCPNEGTAHLLCFDLERTTTIVKKIRKAIGKNTPLILKMAYFDNDQNLQEFVKEVGKYVNGLSAINTIAATIINNKKEQALPGEGRARSGVCGSAITWAGLDMVGRLNKIRNQQKMDFTIIGVGGVTKAQDFAKYQEKGADIVMSATGAMWNTNLANEIWQLNQVKKGKYAKTK
jgi:dihydroorotate dehydrogenase (NAD+) catalytic subunit